MVEVVAVVVVVPLRSYVSLLELALNVGKMYVGQEVFVVVHLLCCLLVDVRADLHSGVEGLALAELEGAGWACIPVMEDLGVEAAPNDASVKDVFALGLADTSGMNASVEIVGYMVVAAAVGDVSLAVVVAVVVGVGFAVVVGEPAVAQTAAPHYTSWALYLHCAPPWCS